MKTRLKSVRIEILERKGESWIKIRFTAENGDMQEAETLLDTPIITVDLDYDEEAEPAAVSAFAPRAAKKLAS